MLIKIMGNVLVIVSASLVGFYFSLREAFRREDLLQLKRALGILRSEIEYLKTPLPEAFLDISSKMDKPFSDVFADISKELYEKGSPGVALVWEDVFKRCGKKMYLAAEDLENIYSFGKTLGYLDRTMQLNSISMLESYIDMKNEYLEELSAKNKKMYGSLGVLCGILICVVLL